MRLQSGIRVIGVRAALVGGVSMLGLAAPALGQAAPPPAQTTQAPEVNEGIEEIVVTAQRAAQSLQDVPIAISAFTADALQKQQINNSSDLQLTLPNITFTKGNFTGSSFTIRGIGDLCVGGTCDSATAIHTNDLPLFGTRLFETEFFDLERVEVLRGPQGTLFGRNATSGVINFITAKPTMDAIHAAGEVEYGNYDSLRVKGMFNLPITETLAARVAGFYLKRDGYTTNLFDNSQIDGRDMYAIRGSLRWQPTDDTTIDLMGYYFREDDDRLRIQKQKCQRDPTGVLGCLPGQLGNGVTNFNSTFVGVLTSREFLTTQGGPAIGALALGSLYGPDSLTGNRNIDDPRVVDTDTTPTYFTDEIQAIARIEHDFGPLSVKVAGLYQQNSVDSSQDYYLSVQNPATFGPGLTTLLAYGAGPLPQFGPAGRALLPNGVPGPGNPNGVYCVSQAEPSGTGLFGGNSICAGTPLDFDRSSGRNEAYTGEAIVSSEFDGRFNFLLGGIYNRITSKDIDYYVNGFGIDYVAGVLGAATTLGQQAAGNTSFPTVYLGSPFFRNNQRDYKLESYGIFGEAYFNVSDAIKVTVGLRYNNDTKSVTARSALASFAVPYGLTNAFDSPFVGAADFDPGTPGNQLFQVRSVSFGEFTGRAVIDWKISDDNLVYASYSRGYKSGGINPPLQPIFAVPESFTPEFIDAYEIGSKNTFLDGTLRLNLTAFYYKYKSLQLSRIVARTAVNDNVDAVVYGVEMDAIIQPVRNLAINLGASYLSTEVSSDKFLSNPRDPSGGRSDAVIIKDISNGANCAVVPTVAGSAAARLFVAGTNAAINAGAVPGLTAGAGLQGPAAFPDQSGLSAGTTGAFSICAVLAGGAAAPGSGVLVLNEGVATNLRGNQLPQAPEFKFSAGIQYTGEFDNGMSLVPRFDLALTGESFGNIFNGTINRIPSYYVMNAQVQLNGRDDRWYLRGFIQNIADNNAQTGLYVTDQSSGLFTNIFTLEPRRYGIAAGFKF